MTTSVQVVVELRKEPRTAACLLDLSRTLTRWPTLLSASAQESPAIPKERRGVKRCDRTEPEDATGDAPPPIIRKLIERRACVGRVED